VRIKGTLARCYVYERQFDEAERLYREVVKFQERHPDPYLGETLNNLGTVYYGQGKYEEAAATFERSLRIREQEVGSESPALEKLLENYGSVLRQLGKAQAAEVIETRLKNIRSKR